MAKTYWLPFQMPRSRFNNLPLRQLPLGSHLPYSQRSVLSDRQRWKCKLNRSLLRCGGSLYMIISASIELDLSNLHSYWYSKCKILYFLHEMAWMRLWWSNYLVKQFFVGVNHVFFLYSFCIEGLRFIFCIDCNKSLWHIIRILTLGNWRIIINYEVASSPLIGHNCFTDQNICTT